MDFPTVFSSARRDDAAAPFPYQRRLAEGDWPDLLNVPTGLGKTAAILTAWLYKRLVGDPGTPRRLVYCLPMRVLVEQVRGDAEKLLANLQRLFEERDLPVPRLARLMGGDVDDDWLREPERPAIIVGTQDMLLSRAMMRGYGMSRYRWPVDFAFLHNDALWVFDEVQLMGAGMATSAQLEAFRRSLPLGAGSRTLWLSATLRPEWLATVDFAPHLGSLRVLGLDDDPGDNDTNHPTVQQRVNATKAFAAAKTPLTAETIKNKAAVYAKELSAEVLATHHAGTTTLVIVNRVDRAQAVFEALRAGAPAIPRLLIHSRFRPFERKAAEGRLREDAPTAGRIVVATQAIEAGVDITSATLFTELAPWASIVQRCGRCNRYGEVDDARVYWIDIDGAEDDREVSRPYEPADLIEARGLAIRHTSASPGALAPATRGEQAGQVLRRKDLIELFNTDPDLSGFDIDISPYIRDADDTDVQVFWRAFDKQPPPDAARANRDELCPVAIGRFRDFIKKRPGAFVWDALDRKWVKLDAGRVRPGLVVMLDATSGGYDNALGFVAESRRTVEPVPLKEAAAPPEANDDDRRSEIDCFVGLTQHLAHVEAEAEALCAALPVDPGRDAVIRAARWHDVGKAHAVFQNAIVDCTEQGKARPSGLLAKSACRMDNYDQRRPFRHELASALAWLAHGDGEDKDLIAYLIAAHHGKVRLGIRALPGEREPDNPKDGRRFARGVWERDPLPAVDVGGKETLPATTLSLAVMELGEGPHGESWTAKTQRLLAAHGPFRLAWLEALVRIADWRASGREQKAGVDDV